MNIDYNLSDYIVFHEETILEALKKISKNVGRIVFSVTSKGVLDGVLTNGDFRRWLEKNPAFDVTRPISRITNRDFRCAQIDDPPEQILDVMGNHTCVPLLDRNGHLVAFARRSLPSDVIRIGEMEIGEQSPTFIIAEIGLNHNGSLKLALELIDLAAKAGANCVKFQMRNLATLYRTTQEHGSSAEDLGAQYTLTLLERFELKPEEMFAAFDHCREVGIIPLCTAWDEDSLAQLEAYGMAGYKVASADLTNHDLIAAIAGTGKPVLCSTGMSTEEEIREAVTLFQAHGAPFVLLHCNSTYPAPFKDINLRYLNRLRELSQGPVVGYSGHERGTHVVMAAVAMGAKVIEKHFTIDKEMEGNDHKVSLLPEEFAEMVRGIRQIEQSFGEAKERKVTQGEMMNRSNLAKSLLVTRALAVGEIITAEDVEVRSPGRGLQPNRRAELIGRKALRTMQAGDFFFPSDLGEAAINGRDYKFRRPWGIPVRYHDLERIRAKSNPDFLEFHLSFKDMDHDVSEFFHEPLPYDLVVHSPDLFAGDHLLNLASDDEAYRRRSVSELQRVVNVTRALKPYFTRCGERPIIIASLGGFSKDAPFDDQEIARRYEIVARSLAEVDQSGVEIIPQTLPPFPWYFGGQLFANLFVKAEDTLAFCQQHKQRLCFDICHSKLTCNHLSYSFEKFVETVGPVTRHLHICDAGGVDGEGLQIGEGDIDFTALAKSLDRLCPEASFIPEIWQGHKNEGEGFWLALARLESTF